MYLSASRCRNQNTLHFFLENEAIFAQTSNYIKEKKKKKTNQKYGQKILFIVKFCNKYNDKQRIMTETLIVEQQRLDEINLFTFFYVLFNKNTIRQSNGLVVESLDF